MARDLVVLKTQESLEVAQTLARRLMTWNGCEILAMTASDRSAASLRGMSPSSVTPNRSRRIAKAPRTRRRQG